VAGKSTDSLFRDMSPIFNRVYKIEFDAHPGKEDARIARELTRYRCREDAKALADALEGLRDLRERSQGLTALRDEIDYLREQVLALRYLNAQITVLRLELARPPVPLRRIVRLAVPDGQRLD
jgi:hypothetical protein